ncbi:MAG: transposase [Dissulfuribacterales bacterium]
MKRKKHSKELKTKVALAAIKGNQTVNEIASEFGIHTSLVNRWKKKDMDEVPPMQIRCLPEQVKKQMVNSGFKHVEIVNELPKHFLVVGEKRTSMHRHLT